MTEIFEEIKNWVVQNWKIVLIALGIIIAIALVYYFASRGKATEPEAQASE